MTWIKICGITNLEDAQLAVDAGADALGLVFYEKSPRRVEVETAKAIVEQLPEKVEKVGVFVGHTVEDMRRIVEQAGLTAAQVHGESSRELLEDPCSIDQQIGIEKVIAVLPGDRLTKESFTISTEAKRKLYAVLFDSCSDQAPGGTGVAFNWQETKDMIQAISLSVPVIVAGGLNSFNVAEAMNTFQPFGVDVASGTEVRPGKKDPQKVRAFVEAVKAADKTA